MTRRATIGPDASSADDWRVFGTGARLVVTEGSALGEARAVIDAELAAIDLAASRFRDDSELIGLNRAAGETTAVSALLVELLQVALDAAKDTDGAVDPTLGVSLREVGYDRTFREIPDDGPAILVTTQRHADWTMVELDADELTVRIPEWVELDLGATAKAYAADRAAAAAFRATGTGVLLSLGGDIAVAGPSPSDGWPILMTDDSNDPLDTPGPVVALHHGGLATSSTSARRWLRGGETVHHLLDPWTGRSASGPYRTVSVAADTCVQANVAATATIVLGARDPHWLERQGLAARVVQHDGTVRTQSGWPKEPS
jgi:thiamine biosynthesis lipoprotein ApbE